MVPFAITLSNVPGALFLTTKREHTSKYSLGKTSFTAFALVGHAIKFTFNIKKRENIFNFSIGMFQIDLLSGSLLGCLGKL
tara:strand:+ start:1328 stop:1570 length:243 start_codon:yes stop_codon:yes gene_type:complete